MAKNISTPKIPLDEADRLLRLHQLAILDTAREKEFDELVQLATTCLEMPIAAISFVEADRQWFKAKIGIPSSETPRNVSFCAHALNSRELFIVEDATKDDRFKENPFVLAENGIRFYAGVPLLMSDGSGVGTLCVLDRQERQMTEKEKVVLQSLARQVEHVLELREKEMAQRQLLSLISDEVRSPLSLLLMHNDLIAELLAGSDLLNVNKEISKRIDAIIHVVDTALDYSEVLQSDYPVHPVKADIHTLARDVVQVNESLASVRKITIDITQPPGQNGAIGYFDEGRMRHLFNIFVQDVIKHCSAGAHMNIHVQDLAAEVQIDITDDGPKIRSQDAIRLCRPLSSVVDQRSKNRTRGLGLFIAMSIVKTHKGSIHYMDDILGTHFRIILPKGAATEVAEPKAN